MSTNELNTLARDLKELRLMAEQLDAEIKTIEDAIKAHMTEHSVDTLITTDVKITWRTVTSSRMTHKGEAHESFPFSSFWPRTHDYRRRRK